MIFRKFLYICGQINQIKEYAKEEADRCTDL